MNKGAGTPARPEPAEHGGAERAEPAEAGGDGGAERPEPADPAEAGGERAESVGRAGARPAGERLVGGGRAGAGRAEAGGERLQKVLARAGIGSRRAAEELITAGRVTVNDEVAVLGRRVDVGGDRVAVDGAPLSIRPGLVYYLLNKPGGVVTTADDPHGRPTVVELVPSEPRVFPVGRLDAATEGLLMLTNDGALTQHLTHPRFGVDKEYVAVVVGHPSPGAVRRLRQGVDLDDGRTSPARVALVAPDILRIVIHEGRNRQVRRMCEAVGHPVRRLVRTRIGPISDRRLAPGTWRPLTASEVRSLADAAASSGSPVGNRSRSQDEPPI